ncbi:MAG: ablA, partial [Deltaproteobacteria bacterium]|nr:ablA [Deltaproteobacteria bacterium]
METHPGDDAVPLRRPKGGTTPVGLPWPQVTREQWNDYRWQLSNRITSVEDLPGLLGFSAEETRILSRVSDLYRMGITPYYFSLMRFDDADDPIARQ